MRGRKPTRPSNAASFARIGADLARGAVILYEMETPAPRDYNRLLIVHDPWTV